MNSSNYYQRLISIENWDKLWSSVTWIIDLLPLRPYDAINVIKAYYAAHYLFLTDYRIYGKSDAISLIEAKYINHKLPISQILQDLPTRDRGYDILAINDSQREYEKLHIERYIEKVGVKIIRGVLGILNIDNATKGVIVTTSDFTKSAYYEAKKSCRLKLINIDEFDKEMRKNTSMNWAQKISEFIIKINEITFKE